MRVFRKIKEVGVTNTLLGAVKKVRYYKMMQQYHFESWHLSPYEWSEYLQKCAKYVNSHGGGVLLLTWDVA